MREDMYKVVINRPRYASRFGTRTKLRYLDDDEQPFRITGKQILRRKSSAMTKEFNDHVMPLKRYLNSQRGRKWDDVFSEICEHLDTGSTVKMHVHEHIDGFIMRKVRVDEKGRYWGHHWGPTAPDRWWPDLYVCPHDGLIKETEELRKKLGLKKRKHNTVWYSSDLIKSEKIHEVTDKAYIVEINGIWYMIKTDQRPYERNKALYDILKKAPHIGCYDWKVISKKQLSKKELKQHGLKNSYDDGGADV